MRKSFFLFGVCVLYAHFAVAREPHAWTLDSPGGVSSVEVVLSDGSPQYAVTYKGETIITPSRLGLVFDSGDPLDGPFRVVSSDRDTIDETWRPVWGQYAKIVNRANQLILHLAERDSGGRQLDLIFRAYDDGIAFRYHLPRQSALTEFRLTDELTTFSFNRDHRAWWIDNHWDTYERDYRETPLSTAAHEGMNTPVTLRTDSGIYVSLHEADLTDWAGMTLVQTDGGGAVNLEAALVPWFESNIKVNGEAPHSSPWRTIQLASSPGGLVKSSLILNLNDPCALDDTTWIQPAKFMGIWWGCITGVWNWELQADPNKHGATTARAKRYIDACARQGIPCLLIEGWCEGWEGDIPGWGDMNLLQPYPDFDIQAVTEYGRAKGVTLIGHHETGGNIRNYEDQLPEAFEFYRRYGINRIKTGYVTGDKPVYSYGLTVRGRQHHHGQFMVNHHQRVVELAAKYQIMIDAHEPIKATGISRTWPNFVAREGGRGGEFNHFIGNPPSQACILPFTRLLGGPMDYTPGLFDCAYDRDKRFSTRAFQLALFVILWSPLQMAADFYQAYEDEPAMQFIRNVPVGKWDETQVPLAEIGDYVVTARRQGQNWFVGAITNQDARTLNLPLTFLSDHTRYHAIVYADGDGADYQANPYPVNISESLVSSSDTLPLELARGGGAAIEFYPEGIDFTRPSPNPGPIDANREYRLRAKHSGHVLSVRNAEVVQHEDDSAIDQRWKLIPVDNGMYRIATGDQVLTARGNDNGAPVTLENFADDPSQKWKLDRVVGSWYRVFNSTGDRVLDVAEINYANGGRLHLWEWAHSPNQIWSLERVAQ
jgi:alpha-glucosidase